MALPVRKAGRRMARMTLVRILAGTYLMEQLCSRGPPAYIKNSERFRAWNSMNCHFVSHSSFPFPHAKQLFRQHSTGYWMFLHAHVNFRLLKRNSTVCTPWQSKGIQLIHGSYTTDRGIKKPQQTNTPKDPTPPWSWWERKRKFSSETM